MCDSHHDKSPETRSRTIPVTEAVGTVLAHDITEIRPGEFKGRAFKKGHVVRQEDICHLQRLGKEHLYALTIPDDEMHENDAAYAIANALIGEGVKIAGEPKEGKINIISYTDGLLKVKKDALFQFNMVGDVMCATLHNNTPVKKGADRCRDEGHPPVSQEDNHRICRINCRKCERSYFGERDEEAKGRNCYHGQ